MSLINCKVKLKLKWMNHCVLSANGNDYDDANFNNIVFTIKDGPCSHFISKRQPKTIKTS